MTSLCCTTISRLIIIKNFCKLIYQNSCLPTNLSTPSYDRIRQISMQWVGMKILLGCIHFWVLWVVKTPSTILLSLFSMKLQAQLYTNTFDLTSWLVDALQYETFALLLQVGADRWKFSVIMLHWCSVFCERDL